MARSDKQFYEIFPPVLQLPVQRGRRAGPTSGTSRGEVRFAVGKVPERANRQCQENQEGFRQSHSKVTFALS
jgi:hypothetical protein